MRVAHTFRHTAAVHLIASGVDVAVVQSWMGHANFDTPKIYAQANLAKKRKAIERADGSLRPSPVPRWKRDADLQTWLNSFSAAGSKVTGIRPEELPSQSVAGFICASSVCA